MLRANTYSYLTDNNNESKKEKVKENLVMKRKLILKGYKNCLEANHLKIK